MDTFTFNDKSYTEEDLKAMSVDDLLVLRNSIATSLGVTEIKSFKDHDTAVAQTMKAGSRLAAAGDNVVSVKPKKEKKVKEPRGPRPIPKSAMPQEIKRPSRKHFCTIMKTGEHDGTGKHGRAERWPNYKDGMTIADVIEGNGTEPWDVYNWEAQGIMKVVEPTDAEYAERRAAWFKKHNREDPEAVKAAKAKAKAEAEAAKAEAAE